MLFAFYVSWGLIICLPIFIAQKRGLKSGKFTAVVVCSLLSYFLSNITVWLVALILSVSLKLNEKDKEMLSLNKNIIEKKPQSNGILKNILLFCLLVILSFFYGQFYYEMGPWMLVTGVCFVFWVVQIKLFYDFSLKRKYWTIFYALFNISSVCWMLLLNEYHNEGSGSQSSNGLGVYWIGSYIFFLSSIFLNKLKNIKGG